MKIIELTETQYRNYSRIHSNRNFGQTVEFSMLHFNVNKKRYFLGLVDEYNNLSAATLILVSTTQNGLKEALAPNGYLIDYSDYNLVKTFHQALTKYLKKEHITYLITNPMFKYRVMNKKNTVIENNTGYLNNLYSLGYKSQGYNSEFEKYDVIIENDQGYKSIYNNFNRITKRKINEGITSNIKLVKGTYKDLPIAYEIIKKKTNHNLEYYQNLQAIYNNPDNQIEIFFTKLNPNKFLIEIQKKYQKAEKENIKIHRIFDKKMGHITEKLLNKKIESDKKLQKAREDLNKAIIIDQNNKDDIIIGTSIIIKNNHEIYFLIDGFKEIYRFIHSTHIIKWAIIKKYSSLGYKIFNLGEINLNYLNKENKYYGQFQEKIGFGGNIVEYTPNLIYIINKPSFSLYQSLNKIKKH